MSREAHKRAAALAAADHVEPGSIVGVGTGSTAEHFIDALAGMRDRVGGAVASSTRSAERLRACGVRVLELNEAGELPLYVDGADEATSMRHLIKGGGGALTREKILAAASRKFVCIVDDSKLVLRLGSFPLALEVLPVALAFVTREIERLGGRAVLRRGFTTDDGNPILDAHGLPMPDPSELEARLECLPGVVACGLFCRRPADLLLVGGADGVRAL